MKRMTKALAATALLGTLLLPMAAQAYPGQYAPGVNHRLSSQHARIENGVRSGELTRGEAYRLRTRDRQVARQDRRDRRTNGGTLTAGERRHQERELNHDSRAINRLDSNGHVR